MKEEIKKIFSFFAKSEKKKIVFLIFLSVLLGFVEMLGISSILPFMAVLSDPSLIHNNRHIHSVITYLNFTEQQFMLFMGGIVFILLLSSNLIGALNSWFTLKFCYAQGKKISYQLFEKYLNQPYTFFLNHNTSELASSILGHVDRMINHVLLISIQLFAKICVMLFIITLLMIVDIGLALSVTLLLGGTYVLIYKLIKQKMGDAGRIASEANRQRFCLIYETMGAIKEIKVLQREQLLLNKFKFATNTYAKAESLSHLLPPLTKYVVEGMAFGGMMLIALYSIAIKQNTSQFLPLLGLYALAGYRLMPAMHQMFSGFSSFKYHFSSLERVYQEMKLTSSKKNTKLPVLPFNNYLKLKEVDFYYPRKNPRKPVLKAVSLDIRRYSVTGIVGASGAGKTTLIDLMLGLFEPKRGRMEVDGTMIDAKNVLSWQKNVGYVPQDIFLFDTTIANNIALGINPEHINYGHLERAVQMANLDQFIEEELPEGYDTMVGERGVRLSGGQRQRIGIARALYHDPELLIFDEATSALDASTEQVIMEAIQELGHKKTIIIVAHRLNTIKHCDTIYVLDKGRIAGKGNYEKLSESNAVFQALANVGTSVKEH